VREHQNSFVVEGSPAQAWSLWFGSIPAQRSSGLEEFLRAIPDFELDGDDPVSWKPGQIRGPSRLLLRRGP
jgi:hypothetical protein